jgi:hypothetical protein
MQRKVLVEGDMSWCRRDAPEIEFRKKGIPHVRIRDTSLYYLVAAVVVRHYGSAGKDVVSIGMVSVSMVMSVDQIADWLVGELSNLVPEFLGQTNRS